MAVPDPTAGFTDMQWYMYHQRNVAFYERHGFVVKGRRSLPNDVTLVGLLREP